MNNRTFYITEEQQRRLLNEITIKDKFEKEREHTKWSNPRDFQRICQSDPTYNMDKDIVGKYTNWLLLRLNDLSDLERVRVPLEWYVDGMKRGILQRQGISPDINTYKSVDDFISAMQSVMKSSDEPMQSASEMNNREKLAGQFNILGESKYWEVINPLTFEAERWFGRKTKWCTVANESYFKRYGELFIYYPKDGKMETRIQIEFKSKSFFNVDDVGYDSIIKALSSCNDNEEIISDGISLANKIWNLNLKYIKISEVPKLLSQCNTKEEICEIFDRLGDFVDGIAKVSLNSKWNFINENGKLLSNQWFDKVYDFYNGFGLIYLNHKYNFIKPNGEILYKSDDFGEWFDSVTLIDDCGFSKVKYNDRYNFLTTDGEILYKPNEPHNWFINAFLFKDSIDENYTWVLTNYGEYFLRRDGILCDFITKQPIPELNEGKSTKRTFYIPETRLNEFSDNMLTESFIIPKHEQVRVVREYLDKNFLRSESDDIDENGYPCKVKSVTLVSSNGQPLKPMTIAELFMMLDDKFNRIIRDKDKRQAFLKQVITDWYYKRISKEGILSANVIQVGEKKKK